MDGDHRIGEVDRVEIKGLAHVRIVSEGGSVRLRCDGRDQVTDQGPRSAMAQPGWMPVPGVKTPFP